MADGMSTANDCPYYRRALKAFEEEIPFACCRPTSLFLLPEQLQPQLDLPGACGSRSDDAGGGRWSARRRRKYNGVRGIEVRVVEHVKEIRSELRAEAFRQ